MTHEKKIQYLRIACGLCRISIDDSMMDKIVSLYEGVITKEGKFSVDDACRIEMECEDRERTRNVSKMLDKVSKKTGETKSQTKNKNS